MPSRQRPCGGSPLSAPSVASRCVPATPGEARQGKLFLRGRPWGCARNCRAGRPRLRKLTSMALPASGMRLVNARVMHRMSPADPMIVAVPVYGTRVLPVPGSRGSSRWWQWTLHPRARSSSVATCGIRQTIPLSPNGSGIGGWGASSAGASIPGFSPRWKQKGSGSRGGSGGRRWRRCGGGLEGRGPSGPAPAPAERSANSSHPPAGSAIKGECARGPQGADPNPR